MAYSSADVNLSGLIEEVWIGVPSKARSAGLARTWHFRSFGQTLAGSNRTIEVVTHQVRPGSGAVPSSFFPAHAHSSGCRPLTAALPPPWKFDPRAMTARLKTRVTASCARMCVLERSATRPWRQQCGLPV